LESIHIPKSLVNINHINYTRSGIFSGSGLKSVTFEYGITKIPQYLFYNASNLSTFEIPDTVVLIEEYAFGHCQSLTDVTIPDSVTTVGESTFSNCTSLTDIKLSKNMSELPSYLFSGCSSLKEFTIPETITKIGAYVFQNCTSLESVSFLNAYDEIPSYTFYNCPALMKVVFPENVTKIRNNSFGKCTGLKEIELPESLTSIAREAFYECSSLQEITIPENVATLESDAFYNCDALTEVDVKGLTSIGGSVFYDCDALETVNIVGSGSIGANTFYDCDALKSITIGDKVTSIGSSICYSCDSLTDINLGKGITTIPDSAFRLCQSLESVTIPRFCATIATNAFAENTKLKSAYIPVSVTSIESNSFSYPNIMTIYGKEGSYAQEYSEGRGFPFASLNIPVTTLAYPESSMKIAYHATVLPDMQIMPGFDTDTVTFVSADTAIATVSATGAVYGKSYGTTTITMETESGLSDTIEITVVRPATSVTLNKTALELAAGDSEALTVTVNPNTSTDVLKWSSDNTDVAVVDANGKVTAVGKGTANITVTATYGNKSATCFVTVVDSSVPVVNVTGITLSRDQREITIGKTSALKANVLPEDATNKMVEWTSSNPSVAEVSEGVITAKSLGTTTITAKTVSGGFTAQCVVTVVPKVEITNFNVTAMGAYGLIDFSAVNVPEGSGVYVVAYSDLGNVESINPLTLSGGSAQTILPLTGLSYLRAYIWKKDNIRPLCEPEIYTLK